MAKALHTYAAADDQCIVLSCRLPYGHTGRHGWWDDHTDKVSRRSAQWAASDRGWFFPVGGGSAFGHYLDYGPCERHRLGEPDAECDRCNRRTVHAVSCVTRESRYFATVAEAKTWIEERACAEGT